MKYLEIIRYELYYQLSKVWPWIIFIILIFLSFLFTRDGSISDVLYSEFFLNSPFIIAGVSVLGGIVWLLTAALITGDAAARDVSTGMYSITYATPLSKWEYLGGRITAVLLIHTFLLLALPFGNILSVYLPGVHPDLVGPFRPEAYLAAFLYISVPNLIAAVSLQFFLATKGGKPMAAYLGSLFLFFIAYVLSTFLLVQGKQSLANILDPIGIHFIFSELSHLWTTYEKSHRLLELEGTILYNRLTWLIIAVTATIATFLTFQFKHRAESSIWRRIRGKFSFRTGKVEMQPQVGFNPGAYIKVPEAIRTFNIQFHLQQLKTITWKSFKSVASSWAGIILLTFLPLVTLLIVLDQMSFNNLPLIPTTARVLAELTGGPGMDRWIIISLLIILFAGELVWRERDAGTNEITDTMPESSWVPLLGKFLGITILITLFIALQMGMGMLAQVINGYHKFEIAHYVKVLFGLQLPQYLIFLALALFIHVLINNKYLGHLIALLVLMVTSLSWLFGLEHNLLLYGHGPNWSYTEIRGFGGTIMPWLWFKLYWAAWALFLLFITRLFWMRGRENSFRSRWSLIQFSTKTKFIGIVAVSGILLLGGFIFYNIHLLNDYYTEAEKDNKSAQYEQLYSKYKEDPQPSLEEANLHIEIYPNEKKATIKGSYFLVNRQDKPVETIHLATTQGVQTTHLTFNRPYETLIEDHKLSHHTYFLKEILKTGDSIRLDFEVLYEPHGFKESGISLAVVENGTYFTNDWLPAIGYQLRREIMQPNKRRELGLPERPVINSLYNSEIWQNREAGMDFKTGVKLTAVIGTDNDQIAVGPGALLDSWEENGRSYYKYKTDAPIGNQWDFFSADYDILEKKWKRPGSDSIVNIKIYHHPEHTSVLESIVKGVEASLDYYTKHYGPYEYSHLTIVERAGSGIGMHAEASLINYSEGSALFSPVENESMLDLPYMIFTHEMAHQWTVPYAMVEGAPVMSEGLAWYYGLKAIEYSKGEAQLREMLQFMRHPYPHAPIRRGEPLLRGLDPYMAYRKAPFALYTLSQYIGEEKINKALRTLYQEHNSPGAPLATTLDLYDLIDKETPDSLKYLLHDLFKINTFWNLEAEKINAVPLENGQWQVTMEVTAKKLAYDSLGTESELQMDEWVDIGVFGGVTNEEPELNKPHYVNRHRIHSGKQTIIVTVDEKPVLAGVDPYHILDWEENEDDNNIEKVEIKKEE